VAVLLAWLGLASPVRAAEPAAEPARVLADVHFVGSSTELDSEARTRLTQDAAWLRDHPDVRVRIVGHTDPVGSVAANQALGSQRAEVVRRELVSLGVAAGRLRTASAGAQDPRCMEESLFCETIWKPGSTQQLASESACPQAPDACFGAERRATFWVVAP
jgi:outer membrane protein OmpA-like peptidoglycan-associated protein